MIADGAWRLAEEGRLDERTVRTLAAIDPANNSLTFFGDVPEGETIRLQRRPDAEQRALSALDGAGLERIPGHTLSTFGSPPPDIYGLVSEHAWTPFMQQGLDALRAAGWTIEFPEDFRHHVLDIDGWDEAVKLVIVRENPAITDADVRAYCEQNLTGYKRPRVIEFRTELPKTPVGKVLRRELRAKPGASVASAPAGQTETQRGSPH